MIATFPIFSAVWGILTRNHSTIIMIDTHYGSKTLPKPEYSLTTQIHTCFLFHHRQVACDVASSLDIPIKFLACFRQWIENGSLYKFVTQELRLYYLNENTETGILNWSILWWDHCDFLVGKTLKREHDLSLLLQSKLTISGCVSISVTRYQVY